MKKFLQIKLAHCSLLLIAFFCFLPMVLKAQLTPTCPTSSNCPSNSAFQIFSTDNSRLVASITETETLVTVQVFMIGESLAESVEFSLAYDSSKLVMMKKDLSGTLPIQTLYGGSEVVLLATAIDMNPVLISRGWKTNMCQHREAGNSNFNNQSWIPGMRTYTANIIQDNPYPYTNHANKVDPASGRVLPLFKLYLEKKKPGPLTNTDIGFGNWNTQLMGNTSSYWAYDAAQVEYIFNHTPLGPAGGPGGPMSWQETWRFNFRSPSVVTADSIPQDYITETSARLYGTFKRAYGSDITETNTLLSGYVNTHPTNLVAPASMQYNGILRYDTVVNYGYIYTTAKNMEISVDPFSDTLIVKRVVSGVTNATCKIAGPLTVGVKDVFTCDGETFYYILDPVGTNPTNKIPNTDMLIEDLEPNTKYLAWALMEYKFETTVGFYAVDDFEFKTLGKCDPVVQIGSIFSEKDASCGQLGSFEFYLEGDGEYQYQVNGTGTLYDYEAPDFGLVKDLPAGTYWVEVYDVNKPDCPPSVSEEVTIESSGDITVGAIVTNAIDCDSKGSLAVTTDGEGPIDYTLTLLGVGEVETVTDGTTHTFTNLKPGIYSISVLDAHQCSAYSIDTLKVNGAIPNFNIYITENKPAGCAADTGWMAFYVTTTPTGDIPTFKYQIDAGPYFYGVENSRDSIYYLSAGPHTITVWDTCGTYKTKDFVIGTLAPNAFTADTKVIHELIDCNGDVSKGHIIVTVNGNSTFTYDYSYDEEKSWHKMAGLTDTIKNLGHGKYTIHLRSISSTGLDTCKLFVLRNIEIERIVPETLNINNIATSKDPSCGANDGTIQLYVTGGSGAYLFSLNGGAFKGYPGDSIPNLGAGTYFVKVLDYQQQDCDTLLSNDITLYNKDSKIQVALKVIVGATGCGATDASLQATASGSAKSAPVNYTYTLFRNGVQFGTPNNHGKFINLPVGLYFVNATDGDCNASSTAERIDSEDPADKITLTIQNVTPLNDCGTNDGTAEILVSPSASYHYQLDGNAAVSYTGGTLQLNDLDAAKHTLKVWSSCYETEIEFEVGNKPSNGLKLAATPTPELFDCNKQLTKGFIALHVTGGVSNYYYRIDSAAWLPLTNVIDTLEMPVGTYTIDVKDGNGCTYTVNQIEIKRIVPEVLNISDIYVDKNPTICGANDGVIKLNVTGGSGTYLFRVNGQGSFEFYPGDAIPNLGAGTYYVEAIDFQQKKCDTVRSNDITLYNKNSNLQVNVDVKDATGCSTTTGALYATATGGLTTPYSFDLYKDNLFVRNEPTGIFDNLLPGDYVIKVTTPDGCLVSSGVKTINSSAPSDKITLTKGTIVDLTQCGVDNGSANITISPVGSYHYQLNGRAIGTTTGGTLSFSNLGAATYTLTVWSTCYRTEIEFTVNNGATNGLAVTAKPTPELFDCDKQLVKGFIALHVTGGVPNYYYRVDSTVWMPLAQYDTLKSMPVGTYTIDVKDGNGCTYTIHQVEVERITPKVVNINDIYAAKNPSACNKNDGVIKMYVTGGSGTYVYRVNGQGNFLPYPGDTIPNLGAGTYFVEVIDFQQPKCDTIRSNDITLYNETSVLEVDVKVSHVVGCADNTGALYATATGGTGAPAPISYIYNLFNANKTLLATQTGITGEFLGRTAGDYVIEVTDPAGCLVSSGEFTINSRADADQITLSISDTTHLTLCGNNAGYAKISILPAGTYNYQLDGRAEEVGSNPEFFDLSAGTHRLHVWKDKFCAEAWIDIIINNGKDGNGLAFTADPTPELFDCRHDFSPAFIAMHATGGQSPYFYRIDSTEWLPLSAIDTLRDMPVGTYTIDVKDSKGCTYTVHQIEIKRIVPEVLNVGTVFVETNPTCGIPNGQIQVFATGGSGTYAYSYDDITYHVYPDGIIKNLPAGTYRIYVKDFQQQGCPAAVSDDIVLANQGTDLTVTVTPKDATNCTDPDGLLSISVSGGNGSFDYFLTTIGGLSNENVTSQIVSNTLARRAGVYVVTVKENTPGYCAASSGEVTIKSGNPTDLIKITSITPTNALCGVAIGKATVIVSKTAYNYQLNSGPIVAGTTSTLDFSGLSAGNHVLRVWDNCGEVIDTIKISNGSGGLNFTFNAFDETLDCTGSLIAGRIQLNISGGVSAYQYRIDDGAWKAVPVGNTIPSLAVGIYKVEVKDSEGCTFTINNINIKRVEPKILQVGSVFTAVNPMCNKTNGEIQVYATGGSGNYKYGINGATPVAYPGGLITGLGAGTYTISVQDADATSCPMAVSQSIVLYDSTGLTMIITVDSVNACGDPTGEIHITTTGGTGDYTYYMDGSNIGTGTTLNYGSLTVGVYVIDVKDNVTKCIASSGEIRITTIDPATAITVVQHEIHSATCGSSTGSAIYKVTHNASYSTYKYQLDGRPVVPQNVSQDIVLSALNAGTHQLRVWNDCGEVIIPVEITNGGGALSATATPVDEKLTCNSAYTPGNITLTVNNGKPKYEYRYTTPAGVTVTWKQFTGTTTTINDLTAGNYVIEVRDSLLCTFAVYNVKVDREIDTMITHPPVVTTPQVFCPDGNATIANLQVVSGVNIKWYDVDGNLMLSTDPLKDTTYYATQSVGDCESPLSSAVRVILKDTLIPPPTIIPEQTFCAPAYIKDIATDGNTNIKWFDVSTGGTPLDENDPITSGTYYAALSAGGTCISADRTSVIVTIGISVDKPNLPSPQYFCYGALLSTVNTLNNNQIIWYDAPVGGTAYTDPSTTYLVDGQFYYAAQKAGSCESVERDTVQVFLGTLPPPIAARLQSFCDGLTGKTLKDLTVTGSSITWYNKRMEVLPLSTPLHEDSVYYASQSAGGCESDTIPVSATAQCYKVYGTVFPFVHWGVPAVDALFGTTAILYVAPDTWVGQNPVMFSLFNASLPTTKTTQLVLYDGTIFVPGTPLNPGTIGNTNNPGWPIRWVAFLGKLPPSPVNNTSVISGQVPLSNVGLFTFNGVAKGTYILEIRRAGFITRWAKIEVKGDTYLGHREILGGDGITDNAISGNDLSNAYSRFGQTWWGTPQYTTMNSHLYDVDGSGDITTFDVNTIKTNMFATYNIYEDTWNWLQFNTSTIVP